MGISDNLRRWLLDHPGTRIPLKHPPLPVPGQDLSDQLDCALMDLLGDLVFLLACPVIAAFFWIRFSWGEPARVWFVLLLVSSIVAGIPSLLMWVGLRKRVRRVRDLRLGLLAERAVGQQLERCRCFGYSVFHDIRCEKGGAVFNIDHMAVGPAGVFVVETKGRSKPAKGDVTIWTDGEVVRFANGSYDSDSLRQVQANVAYAREWIASILKARPSSVCQFGPGRDLPVKGLLVYPGWFVDYRKSPPHAVNVTNEDLMVTYIKKREPTLSDAEALELGEAIGEHLRDQRRWVIE